MIQSKNNPRVLRGLGISKKIILFFCLTTLIITLVGIGFGYFFSSRILHEAVGQDYEKMAEDLAITTSGLLEMMTEHVKMHLTNIIHAEAILEAQNRYAPKNESEIKNYLLEMDKAWIPAKTDSALVTQYTHNKSADRLHTIVSENKYISELFITDRYGGLVASSGKTSDFYQADEEWWQKAYNLGRGDTYISDAEYDESSKTISLAIATAIKNPQGRVIGACKAIVKTNALFNGIANFVIDKTGEAFLVNNTGTIIFHNGTEPLTQTLYGSKEFRKIISGPRRYISPFYSDSFNGKKFAAFAVVKHPLLLKNGITWRIFIVEDFQETFAPVTQLFYQISIIIGIMILLLIPVALVFSNLFVGPIIKLQEAVEHTKRGEFNYPISIKTGDEIEWLADSFREMAKGLSAMVDNLEKEITKHKESELNLKISEENYHTIFESANDAIILRDIKTYKIVDVNKKACQIFYYPKEEMIGLGLGFISAQEAQYTTEKLEDLFRKAVNNTPVIAEWFVKDKFGRKFWVEANLKRINIRGQDYLIAILRDITERKQQLEQKENFIDTVSHELRTPLAAIKESIALALEETPIASVKQKEFLTIAKNNVDRLARLINQVLDIQKIGSGKMDLRLEDNDINKTIQEVYRSMSSLAVKKKINFTLQLGDNLPNIKFDREKITEVITNLVNNAFKFTEAGSVMISSGLKNDSICVWVKDSGIGIQTGDIPKLFQRFIQLKRIPGSSGLGLYIYREIIEIHKGKIWAESVYGKGAVFYFTLPLKNNG